MSMLIISLLLIYWSLKIYKTLYTKKCVNGSTNQIELSVSKLGEYLIIISPIELQNEFADFVKQIDKLIYQNIENKYM